MIYCKNKNHLSLVLLVWLFGGVAQAQVTEPVSSTNAHGSEEIDAIVAVVEGQAVLNSELLALRASLVRQGEEIQQPDVLLERRIEDLLISNQAEAMGIHIGDKQIDETIANIAAQNNMPVDQLYASVAAQGLSHIDYRKLLREQLLRMQIVQKEIEPLVTIDRADLISYMKLHPDRYAKPPAVELKLHTGAPGDDGATVQQFEDIQPLRVNWADLDEAIREWIVTNPEKREIRTFPQPHGQRVLVVQFIKLHASDLIALEDVEDEVYELVHREKIERAFQYWLTDLKSDAWIERFRE